MGWLTGWALRRKFTIEADRVDATYTGVIPIVLNAAAGIGSTDISSIFDEVGANYKKIAITLSNGTTEVVVEVEKWDSGAELARLFLRGTFNDTTDTEFYIYYDSTQDDNTSIKDPGNATTLYPTSTNEEWEAVYHLAESAGNFIDSTENDHDSDDYQVTARQSVGLKSGHAVEFVAASDDYINTKMTTEFRSMSAMTAVVVGYLNAGNTVTQAFVALMPASDVWLFGTEYSDPDMLIRFMAYDVGNNLNTSKTTLDQDGSWKRLIGQWAGSDEVQLWVNGTALTREVVAGATSRADSTTPVSIGGYNSTGSDSAFTAASLDGFVDEVWLCNTKLSDSYVKGIMYAFNDDIVNWSAEEAEAVETVFIFDRVEIYNIDRVIPAEIDGIAGSGEPEPPPTYTLTANVTGSGTVVLDPPGGVYVEDTVVTLNPGGDSGWEFDSWSGDLTGSDDPDTLIMTANKEVTATFTEIVTGVLEEADFDFTVEAGSGTSLSKDALNEFSLSLAYDNPPGNAEKYWFLFAITGNAADNTVQFTVNITGTLASRTGDHPVYSFDDGLTWTYVDNINWATPVGDYVRFTITFPPGQNTAIIAAAIPYYYTDLVTYAAAFGDGNSSVDSYASEGARDVYIFTIDDGDPSGKDTIWIIAGQEPCEYWPQHMMQAAIEYLVSADAAAVRIRAEHNFKFIPMINPDGSFTGQTQRNGLGRDITIQWDPAGTGVYEADAEVQGCIDAMDAWEAAGHPIDAWMDMHSMLTGDEWNAIQSADGDYDDPTDVDELFALIAAGTLGFGNDGIGASTWYGKGWHEVAVEYGCATILWHINQWREQLVWGWPANYTNFTKWGEEFIKSLEGYNQ